MMILVLLFLTSFIKSLLCNEDCYSENQAFHPLSSMAIEDIVQMSKAFKINNLKQIFHKINKVRPVGSLNHETVRKFIRTYLSNLQWNVEEISFDTDTVIGPMSFVNIIGTQNVTKSRRLVLACHYDSLRKPGFVGSIDSAMSCAMMLSIAEILTPLLKRSNNVDLSLELIFFDGEEAFVKWSPTDSLYGSRYLASLWDQNPCSRLNNIDTMVLLDLLGAIKPRFYSFKNDNGRLYKSLKRIESRIAQQENIFKDKNHPYFLLHRVDGTIQDDHIPFMEKGVPIVHLISIPFPQQWHKITDNAENIDWNTSEDLELILSVFVVQYFNLGTMLSTFQK